MKSDASLNIKTGFKVLCLLLLSFLLTGKAFAAIENVRFERLPIVDSLSQQHISVIFQDSEGFMWFGTQEGLNRYDGYKIEIFTKRLGDPNSISSSWITAIIEDDKGKLWVGTRNGVNRFNPKTRSFERFTAAKAGNGINGEEVRDIWKDNNGAVWVATRNGLNKFIESENRFKHYNFTNDDGKPIEIYEVVVDLTGAFWLGTLGNGLFRFDAYTESLEKKVARVYKNGESKKLHVSSLFIDSSQKLWIGTINLGVYRLDFQAQRSENMEQALEYVDKIPVKKVTSIIEDNSGTIWFGTNAGLTYYANGVVDTFTSDSNNKFSITDNMIFSLFIDRSGVFWVGSFKGLDKWNTATTQFDHYTKYATAGKRISGNNITFVSALQDGRHIVGSLDGLDFIDPKTGEVESYYHDPENPQSIKENSIMSAAQSRDGKLWLGYQTQALSYYDLNTSQFTHFTNNSKDPNALQKRGVTSIYEARDGTMWFGTFGGGLSKYNSAEGNFTTYRHEPSDFYSISSDAVMSIFESPDGLLWLGTWDAGVSIFNPKTGTAFRIKPEPNNPTGLGASLVWAITEDRNGNMWIGTQGGGLNFLSKENKDKAIMDFTRFTQQEGLPSDVVYGVIEDESGMLWLSTNRGLTRFDPETLEMKNFTAAQGIQSNEFNSGAYFKTESGVLLFGGPSGVTAFHPDDILPSSHKPATVITAFNRLNEQMQLSDIMNEKNQIALSHKDYLIGFEFAGLDFVSPKANSYKYRLVGFDDDWINGRGTRLATYTNLPAGNYTFEVLSSNSDGVWGDQPARVNVIVSPAPWLSPYAYALYAILLVLMVYGSYRYYQNKMRAQSIYRESLEQEVNKRTQELSQANEQLLKASITDQLTGLFNRRYLFDVLENKSKSTYDKFINAINANTLDHETGPRLFFLMFDLDGFKPINDTYGHDAGDKMIQQVSSLLSDLCRMTDTVIRWGGDEFVVVGEITHIDEVTNLANNIRRAISKHGFDIGLAQRMHLSCSIGFSVYPFSHHSPDSVSWEQVHLLADKALYMSKDNGRNTWSGIVQAKNPIPFTTMNTLNQKLDGAIANNDVKVLMHRSEQLQQLELS